MIKQNVYLIRTLTSDQGTSGMLVMAGFNCYTLELPWRDNQKSISCIPDGEYEVIQRISAKFGKIYWITNVPNRSYILIHSGNYAGDISKGYKSHVQGCILLGQKIGTLAGQKAVLNSRITLRKFMNYTNMQPFKLTIIGEL
jgi:hypothetical protein